jgi:serine/threonine protein kinase/Tfp pilus assembly protein PilF
MASGVRRTVDDIFHIVCDLEREAREAYLDTACAGNDQLRKEIEDLLKYYESTDTFLEKPALHDAAQQLAKEIKSSDSAADTLREGDWMIGPYRILDQIGKGGMGVVYLAEDTQNNRQVAIKVLPADFILDEDRLARFNREARMLEELKRLKHPNIAEIYEQTEHEGKPCLVLEYVPGETLADILDRGPLPVAEALRIGSQVADALAVAHRQHIVHRDLKPANIKITPQSKVKVLDFGLAKRFYPDSTDSTASEFQTRSLSLTESGMLIGTPAYMSPEQWDGKEIDQRADLWAFGCLLFEMLTGQPPFARKTRTETMKAALRASPAWQLLPQETPLVIQDLLRKCLQKDVNLRLQDAGEAQRAIAEARAKRKFAPLLFAKSQAWRIRRHAGAIAIATVLTIFAVWAVWYWLKISQIPQEKYIVVLPFKGFKSEQAGVGFAEELRQSLANISDEIHAFKPPEYSAGILANADLGQTFLNLGVNLILTGEVVSAGERVVIIYRLQNSHRYFLLNNKIEGRNSSLPALQNQIAREIAGSLNVSISNRQAFSGQLSLNDAELVDQYLEAIGYLQGDLTRDTIERPIKILENLLAAEPNSPRYLAALAQAYLYKFNLLSEPAWADKAREYCERALSIDHNSPEVQITRGLVLTYSGKYDEAINSFTHAISQRPYDIDAILGLAGAYEDYGKTEEAEKTYLQAIDRWPHYWGGHNELGSFYLRLGRFDEAEKKFWNVININKGPYGYVNIANTYFAMGRYEDARKFYLQSIEAGKTMDAYIGLGTVQFYLEQYREAVESFKAGIAFNDKSPLLWGNLGDAYRQILGEDQEAIKAYDQAIMLRKEQSKSEPVGLARLAELFAKKSTIRANDPEKSNEDKRTAMELIQGALKRDPDDVMVISAAIIVFHLAGDRDRTLQNVERALENGFSLAELQGNPELNDLRLDNRYQEIVKRFPQ